MKDSTGNIWITPSEIDKSTITPGQIVKIRVNKNFDIIGVTAAKKLRPSIEHQFHLAVYAALPDMRAVIHAHPCPLLASSVTGIMPDTGLHPFFFNMCGKPAAACYGIPGSRTLTDNIKKCFTNGNTSVIMNNHGAVVCGHTLKGAYERFTVLNLCAQLTFNIQKLSKQFKLYDAKKSTTGLRETSIRRSMFKKKNLIIKTIGEFYNRGVTRSLFCAGCAVFSARLTHDVFLLTFNGTDYYKFAIDKNNDNENYDDDVKNPVFAFPELFKKIYARNPSLSAVVSAFPPHSAAFALSGKKIITRSIPESWVFLRDIPLSSDYKMCAELISKKNPVVLCREAGVTAAGESVCGVYNLVELLETCAEIIFQTRHTASIKTLTPFQINALKKKFLPIDKQ